MKQQIKKYRRHLACLFGIVCLAVLAGVCGGGRALADSQPAYRLQISPLKTELKELDPGSTYNGSIEVQNTGTKAYDYIVSVSPYNVSGATYSAEFETESQYTEMVDWIEIINPEGTVEPGASNRVDYTITVPEDAPGRGQRAALVVQMVNPQSDAGGSNVESVSRIASLLYGNVSGDTRASAEVIANEIPGFLFVPPIVATSTVKNTGNVYGNIETVLEVREIFNDKVVFTNAEDVNRFSFILPETERYNEVSWEGAPQLGIFKVKQTITIFDEVSTVEKVVFLCPMWFLVIVLIFVFVAIFWIVSRLTGRKKA